MHRQRNYSVEEVKAMISGLESRCYRLLGFQGEGVRQSFRQLLTLCNSVAIVFMQYGLLSEACPLLNKALKADECLERLGPDGGRVATFSNLAMYHYKQGLLRLGGLAQSLKYLYKAEELLCSMRQAGPDTNYEQAVAVNMLSFLCLWRLRRYAASVTHLQYAAGIVSSFIKGARQSIFSRLSVQNLYGLIVMGLAGLTLKIEQDWGKALSLCEDALVQQENEDVVAKQLISSLVRFLTQKAESGQEFLLSPEYEKVLFVSVFIPFVSHLTPVIRASELEGYEKLGRLADMDSRRTASTVGRRPVKVSPERGASLQRGTKPWWEKKKFVDQIMQWGPRKVLQSRLRPLQMRDRHIMLELQASSEQVRLVPVEMKKREMTALDMFD